MRGSPGADGRTARVPRGGPGARLLCALLIAAEVTVAVVALATHDAGASTGRANPARRQAAPTSDPVHPGPAVLGWLTEELPRSAAVLADDAVGAALASHGFRAVGRPADPRYTVSTPALRRLAGQQRAVAAALRAAVPVAVFGAPGGRVVVGEVVGGTPSAVARHRANDAQRCAAAGHALAANPTVAVTPQARAALVAGDVDLRVATVLALLAANGRVTLTSVTAAAPESRAGLPARTITFRATAAAQRALLLGLTNGFRPQSWARLADGSYRATWPIRPDLDDTRR